MNRAMSVGLVVVGVILIVLGVNAAESFASDFKRFFSGTPTDKSIWMLIGGALLAVIGVFGLSRRQS